ncbi:MAG: 6-pyruvoyl-tetrahydropterin synthase-related protein [Bacillota bacterium]
MRNREAELAGASGAVEHARKLAAEVTAAASARAHTAARELNKTLEEPMAYLSQLNGEIDALKKEMSLLEQITGQAGSPKETAAAGGVRKSGEPQNPPHSTGPLVSCYLIRLVAFLNARHFLVTKSRKGSVHAHSWQFQVETEVPYGEEFFVMFRELQEKIQQALAPFENTLLNEKSPFDKIPPVTENIGAYFYQVLSKELEGLGVRLRKLTAWESPIKGVEVSGKLPGYICPVLEGAGKTGDPPETEKAAAEAAASRAAAHEGQDLKLSAAGTAAEKELTSPEARSYPPVQYVAAACLILGAALLAYHRILFAPPQALCPWGSDTWGHLYKAEFLAGEIGKGNLYPSLSAQWYNGCQPFRYWAPLSYYLVAAVKSWAANVFLAGNIYFFLCAFLGGLGWLLLAGKLGLWPAALAGAAWIFWPDNLRVAFSEGNLPRVAATALLPFLFAFFLRTLEERGRLREPAFFVALTHGVILCHAMIGAVYITSLSAFSLLLFLFGGCSLAGVLRGAAALAAGVATSAWWLLPSLKGGLAEMGREAASGGIQFIPAAISFNPLARFADAEVFYWSFATVIIALAILWKWRTRPPWVKGVFTLGILLVLITIPAFEPLYRLLPLHHLLWPQRFSSVAGLAFLAGGFAVAARGREKGRLFKRLAGGILLLAISGVILLDGSLSARLLAVARPEPRLIVQAADRLKEVPGWKVATLDLSQLGSSPAYYFSARSGREQVFGWAWQGAVTAQNIMLLNTSFEFGHYPFLFRSLLFLGATDLVAKEDLVKDPGSFEKLAGAAGYQKLSSAGGIGLWHGRANGPYLIIKKDRGLAVGKHASIYALQFPALEIGRSVYIDDYTPEELARHPVLILSGASCHSRERAERLVVDYAKGGGRVVVDLTGFPPDVWSRQPKFLGVYGEEITLAGEIKTRSDGRSPQFAPFAGEFQAWKCYAPHGLDEVDLAADYFNKEVALWGYKNVGGSKIGFLGLNLAYHAYLTGDPAARKMLADVTGLAEEFSPPEIVPLEEYQVKDNGYLITYVLEREVRAVIPVAALEGMQAEVDGEPVPLEKFENLVLVKLPAGRHFLDLTLKEPPVYALGRAVSLTSLALAPASLFWLYGRKRREKV